jgi:hypothetical protein
VPLSFLPQSLAHALGAQPAGAGAYLVVLVLLLAAYLPGRALAGAVPFASRAERIAVSLALGLVAESTLAFGLGLAGWFTPAAAGIGLALLQLPAMALRRRRAAQRPGASSSWLSAPPLRAAAVGATLGLLLLGAFLATLALYPPLGFDATTYHLPAAREMVESHRLPWLPDSRLPVFPQVNELLFALTLLAGDDRAARCLELAMAGLVALAVYAWVADKGRAGEPAARPRAETSSAPTRFTARHARPLRRMPLGSGLRIWVGVWAGALWLGSPYVVLYGADAYVDVGLALFGFLAVAAVDRWGVTGHPRWAALAGVFAGAAAGVKYQGLFFVALVPIAVFVPILGRERAAGRGRRAQAAALALTAALLVAGPWYGRVLQATGNPVFPFFPEVFGESAWSPAPGPPSSSSSSSSPAESLRALALGAARPWTRWTGPPPFNPWLLALAPAALLLLGRPRAPARAILLGLAYAPCSWLFAPDPRYLLPALPWAAAAAALGLGRLAEGLGLGRRRGLAAAAGLAAALAFAAPGIVYAGYWIARLGPVPRGAEARERFLEQRRPGYAAIAELDRRHGASYTVYVYDAPDLRYFVRGRMLGDWTGPHRYARVVPELHAEPDAAAAILRGWGVDHLLLVEPRVPGGRGRRLELPWRPVYEDGSSRLYDLRD